MKHELDPAQFFEEVAASACEELFARYGVTVRRAAEGDDPVSPDFLLCSVIGFSGRDVCGTLVLALTDDLSGKSNPVSGSTRTGVVSSRSTQRDWVGELSNQLLGRIKIELLRCGVEIYLNLPAVLLGQHLAPLPRSQLKPLKFTLGDGAAAVWIEVEARAGFKIDTGKADDKGPAAGEALLFD